MNMPLVSSDGKELKRKNNENMRTLESHTACMENQI